MPFNYNLQKYNINLHMKFSYWYIFLWNNHKLHKNRKLICLNPFTLVNFWHSISSCLMNEWVPRVHCEFLKPFSTRSQNSRVRRLLQRCLDLKLPSCSAHGQNLSSALLISHRMHFPLFQAVLMCSNESLES